jgi:hypothetical protein
MSQRPFEKYLAATISTDSDFLPIKELPPTNKSRNKFLTLNKSSQRSLSKLSEHHRQSMSSIHAPNRFYDKNISKAMENYKNHMQHTARLYEIKSKRPYQRSLQRSMSSHSRSSSTVIGQSQKNFNEHRQIRNNLHQAS